MALARGSRLLPADVLQVVIDPCARCEIHIYRVPKDLRMNSGIFNFEGAVVIVSIFQKQVDMDEGRSSVP
jgi:hypothetical protein